MFRFSLSLIDNNNNKPSTIEISHFTLETIPVVQARQDATRTIRIIPRGTIEFVGERGIVIAITMAQASHLTWLRLLGIFVYIPALIRSRIEKWCSPSTVSRIIRVLTRRYIRFSTFEIRTGGRGHRFPFASYFHAKAFIREI